MNDGQTTTKTHPETRRDFLKDSAGAALIGGAALSLGGLPAVHAAGSDIIRIGLVGCGGRGGGAALDALSADKGVQLVALGDLFADHLQQKRASLQHELKGRGIAAEQFAVTEERCFVGFDAYKQVINCVDVVLLAEPPHFRSIHLKAAIEAGKHAFVEKPVAVDAPGVRAVLASCDLAKQKGLTVVSGLCWRYHDGMRATVQKILDGSIGDIVALQCIYNTRRPKPPIPRNSQWSDMEYQVRNWYYYTWLSGDHNVEQHVHSLDKMAWVMGNQYPVRAVGMGGRQAIIEGEPGNIFDHHAVNYEFANGVRCVSFCRQQSNTVSETEDYVTGSKGRTQLIRPAEAWANNYKRRSHKSIDMYRQEHVEFFASIRGGKAKNDGEYMCKSTLMAIMGRMASYTGQQITWEQAMKSKQDLSPPAYEFTSLPNPQIAVPGVTTLV